MKHYLLLLWVVFFPVLLVAQTSQFSQKEQDKILKLYTKTAQKNKAEFDKIGEQLETYIETAGIIVSADIAEHPFIDSVFIDTTKIDGTFSLIMEYYSDNQLYTINLEEDNDDESDVFPAMHFFNTIYYGGGIESVVKSTSFTFSFTTKDAIYDVVYEFINQNGSTVISNRYIQKTTQP